MGPCKLFVRSASALLVLLSSCGADAQPAPSEDATAFTSAPNKTVVVGAIPSHGTYAQASGACVTLPSGACVAAKQCASGERRDIIIDSRSNIVAAVCYPADATPPT